MFVPVAVMMAAGLVGCATSGRDLVSTVKIVDAAAVVNCQYLDDVHGTSGYYGIFASRGFEIARKRALAQAAKIGATHIVWQPSTHPLTASGFLTAFSARPPPSPAC